MSWLLTSPMHTPYSVQDRAAFDEDGLPGLNEIVMDEELAAAILKASRHSMEMDASPVDMSNIVTFSERMVKLAEYRRDLYAYLVDKVRLGRPALSFLVSVCRLFLCLVARPNAAIADNEHYPSSSKRPNLRVLQMGIVAPNLAALIGDTVGARLISKAGSLTSLAKCPASTVQILGAEKVRSVVSMCDWS